VLKSESRRSNPSPVSTPEITATSKIQQEPRKRRLSGIALLDFMLAQAEKSVPQSAEQVAPPAKRAKKSSLPEETAQPVRRSKRIAEKEAYKVPSPAKRRAKKTAKAAKRSDPPPLQPSAARLPAARDLNLFVEEDQVLEGRQMTLEEKVAQYFRCSDPNATLPEDYNSYGKAIF